MTDTRPIILWYRRDLRTGDHPALTAACASGRPIIALFIHDAVLAGQGAAPRFRLGLSLASLAQGLADKGSGLILRQGAALEVLRAVIRETGAGAVYWSRLYDPAAKARDTQVKAALRADGITAKSFAGHLLFEPWTVATQTGGFYSVFTPMWRSVRDRALPAPLLAPTRIAAPAIWPASDDLDSWQLGRDMRRGALVLRPHCSVGETAAGHRLEGFIAQRIAGYRAARDFPGLDGTSGLSENLTYGEISPRTCWNAGWRALHAGLPDAEVFLKQLVWREFAYHLIHHTPRIVSDNWRAGWDNFPWHTDERLARVQAWQRGRTGIRLVDAAMREMYVTGRMHNRGRMIVASYLTKHLMCHWKIGLDWFAECLTDWDPASNAMGWQWSAGSGPDASPYFRVFNPVTQLDKFDKDRTYVKRWLAEDQARPSTTALSYFDGIPRRWRMSPDDPYPAPVVTAEAGRRAALAAYQARDR